MTFYRIPKSNFFDRDKVAKAMDSAGRRNLSRAGAFVRTVAQRSMRYTNYWFKHSQRGQPPLAHRQNPLLRKLLFFAYDPANKSVVTGPVRAKGGLVPRLLEEGGTTTVNHKGVRRQVRVEPRPYMGPALSQTKRDLANRWKDSVKRG